MITVLSETQERFFLAIGKQLPLERVIEVHLFQPIRQGGVESGVAVLAALLDGEALPAEDDAGVVTGAAGGSSSDDDAGPDDESDDRNADESLDADGHDAPDNTERALDGIEETDRGEVRIADDDDEDSDVDADDDLTLLQLAGGDVAECATPMEAGRPRRFTVYTAHYRHVLKGPDRGKWEAAVVAEADAPLLTVDVVVRGVLRRSGDATEPERLSGEELRTALRQTSGVAPARR